MKRKAVTSALLISVVVCISVASFAQEKKIKTGLTAEDWAYKLAEGVTSKEVTYYSDGIACYAKLFFPKGFAPAGKIPGVVLGQGWAGSHFSIEKYGARFAESGLVAMVIDYRGWGSSDGFISQNQPTVTRGDPEPLRDDKRVTNTKTDVVLKRTRLIPMKQVEDYRNAISYLQGEPGVDPNRIGVWGSSFAGGNVIVVSALDSRVKAIVGQVPAIGGKNSPVGPVPLNGRLLEDAIKRARTGQGGEFETGFSTRRMVDIETQQMVAEYRPFHYLKAVGDRPVLLIPAEKDELINNRDNSYAALDVLTGPKKLIDVPGITHFEMYIGSAFEISSNAAANWFRQHLGLESIAETAQPGKENDKPTEGDMTASDGVKIHYYVKGKGTPVILIHGYTGSAAGNWLANGIFDALARNHMVVALDCRNHGKSDKPQLNGPGKAEDVVELMDHLKIKRAHFHGYSMGGGIVGRLLTMIPDRMITAAFGGSGITEVDPEWKAKVPPDKEGRDPQEDEVSKRLRIRHAMDNGMIREDAEKLAETPAPPRTAPPAAAARPAGPQLDLTKLSIPMIAINGEFDRPNAKTTRMTREVKNFTNVVLPGKSHLTAISSGYIPKQYTESLVKFIDANDPKM